MKFSVLNDGTILNANGVQVGIITISSDKYKDDIIAALESPYPVSLIEDIKMDYLPDTDSSDHATIEQKMEAMEIAKIKDNYTEIISIINYYK